jgi:transcriptional regulator with XRE-family HTH domain
MTAGWQFAGRPKSARTPLVFPLELLSLFLDVPMDHFWGKQSRQQPGLPEPIREQARTLALRQKLIGASIRLGRTNASLSPAQLAEKTGLAVDTITQYESGQTSIPLPELEVIAAALDSPVESFFDQKGPIGKQRLQREMIEQFEGLSPELQNFVTQPVNLPYLELAIRLSHMDVQKLRSVAEGLLEITF